MLRNKTDVESMRCAYIPITVFPTIQISQEYLFFCAFVKYPKRSSTVAIQPNISTFIINRD